MRDADEREESEEETPAGSGETILVWMGDVMLGELVCEFLEEDNFRTLKAYSLDQASDIWERCREDIRLVMVEAPRPGEVRAIEFFASLKESKPGVRFVYLGTHDQVPETCDGFDPVHYLPVPVYHEELTQFVSERLAA